MRGTGGRGVEWATELTQEQMAGAQRSTGCGIFLEHFLVRSWRKLSHAETSEGHREVPHRVISTASTEAGEGHGRRVLHTVISITSTEAGEGHERGGSAHGHQYRFY